MSNPRCLLLWRVRERERERVPGKEREAEKARRKVRKEKDLPGWQRK